ncbi:N-acetylmuramoyl-L-alanine amidase [Streptomyces pluripotens]|uniref:N-acetylmuramoyl-L-alanine amidase n=2 Tax=Streptomyces TaxID=1883 RepID=A0A221P9E5_9ACTN|nr:N-acetylmuramoyl-L-alanine amidase [Streptomyces pluripotens]ASN28385.1 N-acetylmuramoyl-L-alanine amidase [Streptomyces pluripotens]MCH0556771.1 peptidoglycan recognition protein [Streptomyces sp. MUM 16J]
MGGFLTSSIGVTCVTCVAVLALPSAHPATAAPAAPAASAVSGAPAASGAPAWRGPVAVVGEPAGAVATGYPDEAVAAGLRAGAVVHAHPVGAGIPGSTRSLPLGPLPGVRTLGRHLRGAPPQQGVYRTGTGRFSLVGLVWDDPDAELHGRAQVRTRSVATGKWSGWQDVETHNADHGADPGAAEHVPGRLHGATAPLWVGESDGVDVRVRADAAAPRDSRAGRPRSTLPLPSGLRLELVDPGKQTPAGDAPADVPRTGLRTVEAETASSAGTDPVRSGATEIPELNRRDTELELVRLQGPVRAKRYIGPRPRIVTRRGWGADESLRERGFVYTKTVKAVFVHHTATGNKYTCSQAASVIRSIYRYHVTSMGWRDIGYNFLVDKCGTIYEGRAGGVARAVLGAHTLGFNTDSMGIAVIGTYGVTRPSSAVVEAVARLTAWKLGLYGANPRGKTHLTSGGGNVYPKGKNVRLDVISGHRDGFATECPGKWLYAKLGTTRSSAARYQGR